MRQHTLEEIIRNLSEPRGKETRDKDIDSDDVDDQAESRSLERERYSSDTRSRKWLTIWAAAAVSIWLICVVVILVFNQRCFLGLTDTVLVALLGTTTLNVLGLMYIVLRGYFTGRSSK